jgi:hypothetical protein
MQPLQAKIPSIDGLGWKRIKNDSADGVTNIFVLMCSARSNDRPVKVEIDDRDFITTAYMV